MEFYSHYGGAGPLVLHFVRLRVSGKGVDDEMTVLHDYPIDIAQSFFGQCRYRRSSPPVSATAINDRFRWRLHHKTARVDDTIQTLIHTHRTRIVTHHSSHRRLLSHQMTPTSLFLAALLLVSGVASIVGQSLPAITPEYATTVEFSFSNNGYTLSYDESYSQSNALELTTGRYVDRTTLELTSFSSATAAVMQSVDTAASPVTCTAYSLGTPELSSLLYTPVYNLYQLVNDPGLTYNYVGRSSITDRDVIADVYQVLGITVLANGQYCVGSMCSTPANGFSFSELVDFNALQTNSSFTAAADINVFMSTVPVAWTGRNSIASVINSNAIPLRITINGTMTGASAAQTFSNSFDFVNWHVVDTSVFSALSTANCPTSPSAVARDLFPLTNTVAPAPALGSGLSALSFPQEFTMVVEAPNVGQAGGVNGDFNGTYYTNVAGRWSLDVAGNRESVSYYNRNNSNFFNSTFSLNTFPTTRIYVYNSSLAGGGVYYTINGPATSLTCSNPQLLTNVAASIAGQGLSGIGGQGTGNNINNHSAAGTLSLMFANPQYDTSMFVYMGRATIRSVLADWYRASGLTTLQTLNGGRNGFTGTVVDTFTQDVYLFPSGWQFLGRDNASDYQLPLAVINNGTAYQSGYNQQCRGNNCTRTPYNSSSVYTDIFSIFELLPFSYPSQFPNSPSLYNCAAYVAPVTPGRPPVVVTLPYVNPSYSATVEMNFGTLGYTLSYDEYYNGNVLRADGRYQSSTTIEITSAATAASLYSSELQSIDTSLGTCSTSQLSADQSDSLLYLPSFAILQLLNFSGFAWQNNGSAVLADRNLNVLAYSVPYVNISSLGTFCDALGNCQTLPATTNPDQFHELIDFAYAYDTNDYYAIFNITMYYQNIGNAIGTAPARLVLSGYRVNIADPTATQLPFQNTIDWTYWHRLAPTAFNVATQYTCANVSSTPFARAATLFPTVSTVASSGPAPNTPMPSTSFPSQFSMVLEAQQATNAITRINTTQTVGVVNSASAVRWMLDSIDSSEAITQYFFQNSIYPTTWLYDYSTSNTNYLNGGVYYVLGTDGTSQNPTCAINTLNSTFALNVVNGLGAQRTPVSGSVKELFVSPSYDYTQFVYQGRQMLRSVPADVYVSTSTFSASAPATTYNNRNTNLTQSAVYTFYQYVYLYPAGWIYPGRDAATDLQLPMYIVNNGTTVQTYYNNGVPTGALQYSAFQDSWSIFELIPETSNTFYTTSLASSTASCPPVPSAYILPSSNPTSGGGGGGSSNAGLIAGLVVGLVLGIPLLICIGLYLYRTAQHRSKTQFNNLDESDAPQKVVGSNNVGASPTMEMRTISTDDDEESEPIEIVH